LVPWNDLAERKVNHGVDDEARGQCQADDHRNGEEQVFFSLLFSRLVHRFQGDLDIHKAESPGVRARSHGSRRSTHPGRRGMPTATLAIGSPLSVLDRYSLFTFFVFRMYDEEETRWHFWQNGSVSRMCFPTSFSRVDAIMLPSLP